MEEIKRGRLIEATVEFIGDLKWQTRLEKKKGIFTVLELYGSVHK